MFLVAAAADDHKLGASDNTHASPTGPAPLEAGDTLPQACVQLPAAARVFGLEEHSSTPVPIFTWPSLCVPVSTKAKMQLCEVQYGSHQLHAAAECLKGGWFD